MLCYYYIVHCYTVYAVCTTVVTMVLTTAHDDALCMTETMTWHSVQGSITVSLVHHGHCSTLAQGIWSHEHQYSHHSSIVIVMAAVVVRHHSSPPLRGYLVFSHVVQKP